MESVSSKGANYLAKPSVRLLGHCIFCLRKVEVAGNEFQNGGMEDQEYLRGVPPCNFGGELVGAFNLTWPWVQKYRRLEETVVNEVEKWWFWFNDTPPLPLRSSVEWNVKEMKFGGVPTLCQFCGEMVLEVERAMEKVKEQVGIYVASWLIMI